MKLRDTTLSSYLLVMIIIISHGLAEVTCPKQVTIEEGDTATVSCKTEPKQIIRVYWYKGDSAKTNPILRLENGVPDGTEYGNDHYNISSSGAMIISNAKIMNEALYTTFIYFHDGTRLSRKIAVNITISPWHLCPIIDGCVPCEECNVAGNGTGKLRCTISGVRPMIYLKWIVKLQNGIGIVKHPSRNKKDDLSDTWNSSVEISYDITSCKQEAIMQCVTEDPLHLLKNSTSSVRVYSGNCVETIPGVNTDSSLPITIAVVFAAIFIVGAFTVFIFTAKLKRRQSRLKAHRFASQLNNKYANIPLLGPLQLENNIKVDDVYINCRCIVTYRNGVKDSISSHKLLTSICFIEERCVLLTGVISYWESLFTKRFVLQWERDDNNFIVLLINKKEIKASGKVIDLLQEELSIQREHLIKQIRNKKCIILIHGLCKILPDVNESNRDQHVTMKRTTDNKSIKNLTFSDLFKLSGEKALGQIQVIVTTSSESPIERVILRPYLKVAIDVVEQRQFDEFVEDALYRSIECSRKTRPEEPLIEKATQEPENDARIDTRSNTQKIPVFQSQRIKGDPLLNNISTKEYVKLSEGIVEDKSSEFNDKLFSVKVFLERSQFYTDFMKNPLALSMVVHIVVKEVNCFEENVLSKVKVVCTLVRYLQKAYHMKRIDTITSHFDVNEVLGKLALYLIGSQIKSIEMKRSPFSGCEREINVALQMGFLQQSIYMQESDSRQATELSCLEFSGAFLHYFAANHIVQNELYYTGRLQEREVVEFIEHLAQSPVDHYFHEFRKQETDNDVILYLHQLDDKPKVERVIAEFAGRELQLEKLDHVEHREALLAFCEKCSQVKIRLKSLSISGTVTMPFLRSLNSTPFDELRFCNVLLKKEELFVQILEWLSTKDLLVLRFLKCEIPQTFNEDIKQKICRLGHIKIKTSQNSAQTENIPYFLNYQTATWTKG